MPNDDAPVDDVRRHADLLAQQVSPRDEPFLDASPGFDEAYRRLLEAVRGLDARFAFDRDGRPAAVNAIREALPAMERDLLDAVIDDHACELAAVEEAMYRLIHAYARRADRGTT